MLDKSTTVAAIGITDRPRAATQVAASSNTPVPIVFNPSVINNNQNNNQSKNRNDNKNQRPHSKSSNSKSTEGDTIVSSAESPVPSRTVIPPIILRKASGVIEILDAAGLQTKYSLQRNPLGSKVVTSSWEAYNLVLKAATEAGIDLYTYKARNIGAFRTILTGHPAVQDAHALADYVDAKYNTKTLSVSTINSRSAYPSYKFEFDRSTINPEKLKSMKAIGSHIVQWEKPPKIEYKPQVCFNCALIGHAHAMCRTKSATCPVCADAHGKFEWEEYKIMRKKQADRAPDLRCANCIRSRNENYKHAADDTHIVKYMATRNARQAANAAKNPPRTENRPDNSKPRANSRTQTNKPASSGKNKSRSQSRRRNKSKNTSMSKGPAINTTATNTAAINPASYAEALREPYATQINDLRAQPRANHRPQVNSDLFSPEDIIAREAISMLRACKCKQDQFDGIIRLAVKWLQNA